MGQVRCYGVLHHSIDVYAPPPPPTHSNGHVPLYMVFAKSSLTLDDVCGANGRKLLNYRWTPGPPSLYYYYLSKLNSPSFQLVKATFLCLQNQTDHDRGCSSLGKKSTYLDQILHYTTCYSLTKYDQYQPLSGGNYIKTTTNYFPGRFISKKAGKNKSIRQQNCKLQRRDKGHISNLCPYVN